VNASTVILVRHTAVARRWQGRCYGRSDVGLGRDGLASLGPLAGVLAAHRPVWVVHSDLRRTRRLAERIAALAGCPLLVDAGWQERDFGSWEGRSWQAIYRATGDAMDGMIDAPDSFRPGGGETTLELALRSRAAWRRLPSGRGIVVSHGGPIACLIGQQRELPPRDWLRLVPAPGAMHVMERA
jgi:broad specificity phosphatase PhoE